MLHNDGKGAKYVRGKGPVELVYCKEYRYFKNVLRAERRIKRMTRKQKEALVRVYNGGPGILAASILRSKTTGVNIEGHE